MAKRKYKYDGVVVKETGDVNQWIETGVKVNSETRLIIRQLKGMIEDMKWKGRSGTSDKLVMYSHLYLAYMKDSFEYHASCRHLALLAGVGHVTAIRSTKRLIKLGFISVVTKHHKRTFYANKYSITMHEHILHLPQGAILKHSTSNVCFTIAPVETLSPDVAFYLQSRDVFWNGVDWKNVQIRYDKKNKVHRPMPAPRLGRRSGEIFTKLLNHPSQTSLELSQLVGCCLRTAQYSLEKLSGLGLVFKNDDGRWNANHNREFYEVAQSLNLLGKRDKQYRSYVQDSDNQERYVMDGDYRKEVHKWHVQKKKMKVAVETAIKKSKKQNTQ